MDRLSDKNREVFHSDPQVALSPPPKGIQDQVGLVSRHGLGFQRYVGPKESQVVEEEGHTLLTGGLTEALAGRPHPESTEVHVESTEVADPEEITSQELGNVGWRAAHQSRTSFGQDLTAAAAVGLHWGLGG